MSSPRRAASGREKGGKRGGWGGREDGEDEKGPLRSCPPPFQVFFYFTLTLSRVGHLGGLQAICVVQFSLVFNNGKCNYPFITRICKAACQIRAWFLS